MGMLDTENAKKTTASEKISKNTTVSGGKNAATTTSKTTNKTTATGGKNIGVSAPANPKTLTAGGASKTTKSGTGTDKNSDYVAFDTSGEARDSAPPSSASKTSKTSSSKSVATKNPSSTSSSSSGMVSQAKKPTASPVSRSGPSWEQFDDYVNNTGAFGARSTSSDVGNGATLEELLAIQALGKRLGPTNPMELDTYGKDIPLNPWEQAVENGATQRERRAAEGVTPSEDGLDWNSFLYDMNAPYRQREEDAGGRPFEGPVDWTGIGAAIFGGPSKDERDRALWLERQGLPADYQPYPVGHGPPGEPRGSRTVDPESGFVRDPVTGAYYRPDLLPERTTWVPEETVAAPAEEPQMGPLEGLAAGIEAERRRVSGLPPLEPPLPRPRPAYAGMGGLEEAVLPGQETPLPGQMEAPGQMSDEVLYAQNHPVTVAEEPTTWDRVVEGAGGLLEHTALGGAVKALFPDIWFGGGEMMKGISNSGTVTQGKNGPLNSLTQQSDAWRQATGQMDIPGSSGSDDGAYVAPGATFPDLNHNGIDDRLEGYVPPPPGTPTNEYGRPGSVVFPEIPPYNPGRDDEWLYFRKNAYAEGGEVDPPAGQDPRIELIADTEDVLEDIAAGEKPDKEDEKVLRTFVAQFGDAALRQLHDNVKAGMKMRPPRSREAGNPRLVEGPGTETSDSIPAVIEDAPGGPQPAALSDGEVVIPANAVRAAGNGDREKGAAQLMALSDMLVGRE